MPGRKGKQKRSENKITTQEYVAAVQEWKEMGWTLLEIDKISKKPEAALRLQPGLRSVLRTGGWFFKFGSEGRPHFPPIGIEPTSLSIYDDWLFCYGGLWEVDSPSIQSWVNWAQRYKSLLENSNVLKVKRTPTPIAEKDRQALNRDLLDENIRNQIKTRTIGMAGDLGFLIR